MSGTSDDDLARLVGDLVTTLQDIEAEFEPRTETGLPRPPSPAEMIRLTSDVAIPATILLLRTNIEALKLLQRALRMADGRSPRAGSGTSEVRARAEAVSATTLSKLDGALADLQDAVEGRPSDDEASALLDDARTLRSEIETRLSERRSEAGGSRDGGETSPQTGPEGDEDEQSGGGTGNATGPEPGGDVPVDVDAELRSLKDEVENGSPDGTEGNGDETTNRVHDQTDSHDGDEDGRAQRHDDSTDDAARGDSSDDEDADGPDPAR